MAHETLRDDLFGELTWDAENSVWSGRGATRSGLAFELWIATGAEEMVPPLDDAAVPRAISAESRAMYRRFLADELDVRRRLAEAHEPPFVAWNEETITAEQFQARVRLIQLTVFCNGSAEVFYDGGGLFGGHTLIVHLDPAGDFKYVEMFG